MAGNEGKANAEAGLPDWAAAVAATTQGANAPGNEPGGINGINSQFRQPMQQPSQADAAGMAWGKTVPSFAQTNGVLQPNPMAYLGQANPAFQGPAQQWGHRLPNGVQF